jgi:hypothetical protein
VYGVNYWSRTSSFKLQLRASTFNSPNEKPFVVIKNLKILEKRHTEIYKDEQHDRPGVNHPVVYY